MDGSRISDLKTAARDAVDALLVEDPKPGRENDVRLSMVAYNSAFNAGNYFEAATGHSSEQSVDYYRDGSWHTFYYDSTCVFECEGAEAFTDAAPGPGQYVEAADARRRNDCSGHEPLALTSSRQPLYDYITALRAGGNTAGHLGVAWGWYTVSPNWASVFPAASAPLAYDEPDSAKALILMTDGEFNAVGDSSNGSSPWQAQQLCDGAKAAGKWAGLGGVYDEAILPGFIERGMRFLLGGSDRAFILAGAKARYSCRQKPRLKRRIPTKSPSQLKIHLTPRQQFLKFLF